MAPAVLLAEESGKVVDPLMGAVKFGEHEDSTPLVWRSGRIDYIDETGIIVADLGYQFLPETKFYTASGAPLSWMNFHPGNMVKFVLRREPETGYRISIVSLVKE
jgi:hypothetical protein